VSATSTTGGGAGDPPSETAVLGGGCFWCLEAVFQLVRGVTNVTSGYAGGDHPVPTYRLVCGGDTGHAEVVRIVFDPSIVTYRELLNVFFTIHDPTTPNRQGADVGTQYRSIVLYVDDNQKRTAEEVIREIEAEGRWKNPIVTEVVPLAEFFPAEREHDDYYKRNPHQAYCQVVISPKVAHARREMARLLRTDSPP
jgi:peptide-methionine (S)-S-oxide reductase